MTSPRLLVVDDDPDVRDSLSRALRYAGYQVLVATHGGEALDVVARSPVDLIVLDVLMPIMDGFESCRRLRERGDATPVLMEPCGNTPDQQWQLNPDGHISYSGGRCLDIKGPSANDGTALQIWQCENVAEELWQKASQP